MIKKELLRVGQRVTYVSLLRDGTVEKYQQGIIKNIPEKGNHVFIVYNCEDDWENYEKYDAEWTGVWTLKKGWL